MMSVRSRARHAECIGVSLAFALNACSAPGLRDVSRVTPCVAACPNVAIERTMNLQVYAGLGVTDSAAYEVAAAAAEYYAEHQLHLQLSAELPVPIEFALVGSEQEFTRALLDAGLPADRALTAEELERARSVIGQAMLGGVLPFIDQAASGAPGLALLVTREVVSPQLREFLQLDGELFGLGFPPATIVAEEAALDEAGLQPFLAAAKLDRGIAVVSESKLRSLRHGRENVVAHELGHALGLAHDVDAGNLMNTQVDLNCRPCLKAAQTQFIAAHW